MASGFTAERGFLGSSAHFLRAQGLNPWLGIQFHHFADRITLWSKGHRYRWYYGKANWPTECHFASVGSHAIGIVKPLFYWHVVVPSYNLDGAHHVEMFRPSTRKHPQQQVSVACPCSAPLQASGISKILSMASILLPFSDTQSWRLPSDP